MPEIIDRRVSFNAGEISPWLDPRIDLDKYHMGCIELQNMRPSIYGGAMRRPGTVYMGAAKTSSTAVRLVPFTVNSSTFYVLEFSNLLMRVWDAVTGALVGAPLEVVTPYTTAQLAALQFSQQNDVMWIAHPSHNPRKVIRTSSTVFDLVLFEFKWPATFDENITDTLISVAGSIPSAPSNWSSSAGSYAVGTIVFYTTNSKYYTCKVAHTSSTDRKPTNATYWQETAYSSSTSPTVWSSATAYSVRDRVTVSGVEYACIEANTNKTPAADANPRYWCRSSMTAGLVLLSAGQVVTLTSTADLFAAGHVGTQWTLGKRRETLKVSRTITTATVGSVSAAIYCLGEWSCLVSATSDGAGVWETSLLVERSKDLFEWETAYPVKSSRNIVQTIVTGNEEEPCFLRVRYVSWNSVGTLPDDFMAELEVGNPVQTGIVQITAVASATSATGIVKFQIPSEDPTKIWNKPSFSSVDGFPRALSLHDGRLYFGGTASQPTTLWGSAVDAYDDFRVGAGPDRAVSYTLGSDESSAIEWLVSQDMLVMGTSSAEWVFGQRVGEDVPKLRRNTAFGSAAIQARLANDSVVYVQKSGRKLREYAYSLERDGYTATDLTMLAEHLGDAVMTQIAVQRNPETVIWVTTSRGDLLCLTYERGQNVVGWCRVVTDGLFESVAVVPGIGEEDHVWGSVKRTIGGVDKRYIERFAPDLSRAIKTGSTTAMVFSDSALIRTGAATTTITGLSHLEGKTVKVLGDGIPQDDKVVASGSITITSAANVIVGLGFTSLLQPTFLETSDPGSVSKVGKKRLHRIVAEFWKSAGMTISGDGGATFEALAFEVTPDYAATPGALFTGLKEHYATGGTERQASCVLKQESPLPLNVMSLSMRYEVEMS